jgi:hypothetical protein
MQTACRGAPSKRAQRKTVLDLFGTSLPKRSGPPKAPVSGPRVQLERLMLRDDRGDGGRKPVPARNVLGEPLAICSFKPMTGFYRDGCCNTGKEDVGSHTVYAVMTAEFLFEVARQ